MKNFDLIVIGGGAAGITASKGPASAGWKIAMIEQDFMGGTCTNVGCMPTKALLSSAHFLHRARHGNVYGLQIPHASAEWTAVRERMELFVKKLREGSESYPNQFENITFYRGRAHFSGPRTIIVNNEEITADKIIIAAGARSFIPPVPGIEDVSYLTSTTALSLPTLPYRLAILGGGVLAVEFAQIFSRLGSKVTILEQNEQILGGFDEDMADTFRELLQNEGIQIITGKRVSRLAKEKSDVKVFFGEDDSVEELTASAIMIAAGRKPNSDWLQLEATGVDTDERGFIKTDYTFQTTADGIWAIGDIIGGAMYTHKARHDGTMISEFLIRKSLIDNRNRIIPSAVFTDPEMAVVGASEKYLEDENITYDRKKLPYTRIGRAGAASRVEGFIKLLSEPDSGKLLGAQIIGEQAGEIIHTIVMTMRLGGTLHDLQDMIPIHPTYAEGLYSAARLS